MVEILTEQCKSVDYMFLNLGIEEEQIQDGMESHNLENDDEFKRLM